MHLGATASRPIPASSATHRYDPTANTKGPGCVYPTYGCTDSRATVYTPVADIDDGSCLFYGCTNADAPNFNPTAMEDDGTCEAVFEGCTVGSASNFETAYNKLDGSCRIPGCMQAGSYYNDQATYEPSNVNCCTVGGCGSSRRRELEPRELAHTSCFDVNASNYHENANTDSGCEYNINGCMDSSAINYLSIATQQEPGYECQYQIFGCTIAEALNFDSTANALDLSACRIPVQGCTSPAAANFDNAATVDDGTCQFDGCTDATALNFDSVATTPTWAACRA